MRVLTVDDSRTILAMLHHTLSNAGFDVLQAEEPFAFTLPVHVGAADTE